MIALLTLALGLGTAGAALVTIGDEGLRVTFAEDGAISSLVVGGREVLKPGSNGGLRVLDVSTGEGPVDVRGRPEGTAPGGCLVRDLSGALGLSVQMRATPGPRHTVHLWVSVDDLRKVDRGLRLALELPLGHEGWTWWDEPDVSRPVTPQGQFSSVTRLRELPGLPEFDSSKNLTDFGSYSWYPVAAVTGETGLGLARPPRAASLFRLGFDGPRGVLYCTWDFALSQDTKRPGHAEFEAVLFPVEPAHGFRGALAELYELWPEDFRSRVPDYGGWMPFRRLSEIPNVDEFGFGYQEGASEPAYDDALGVSSFVYFHCAGEFANIPGYARGNPLPPYEEQLKALNALIKQRTGLDDLWTTTGIQLPDGRVNIRPEATYGHIFSQACVDPQLPFGRFMADNLISRVTQEPLPRGVDGCYYDGIAVGLDYSREHFKTTDHPLLWDGQLKRPVAYNFLTSLEWAELIADTVHAQGKMTMLNDSSVSSFPFVFPYIDVLGAEGGWVNSDADFLRTRAYAYHKPFCTLLKTNYSQHPQARIESYMRSCLAFGHLFGFFDISPSGANPGSSYWEHPEWFDRDRELFRRYMPLCAELCRAGWEPVQWATTDTPGAKLERFGGGRSGAQGNLVYFTIRRDSGSEGEAVKVQVAEAVRCARGPDARARDLLTGVDLPLQDGAFTASVPPGEVTVVALGSREAQVKRCLDRVGRLIEARHRYAASLTAGDGLAGWGQYMTGAKLDKEVFHTGTAAVRATLTDPKASAGVSQQVNLNQKTPEDLIVRAFSKAQDVSGNRDSGYSLYVDCYYHDGNKLYGQTIQFEPGTHDWQGGEVRIHPTATIATLSVYCMFRNHTGTVWFDDVFLAKVSEPERNLLQSGDFEPPAPVTALTGTNVAELLSRTLEEVRGGSLDPARTAALADAYAANILKGTPDAYGQRDARDLRDVRDLLLLAVSVQSDKPLAAQWPQRLTPPCPLGQPRVSKPAPRTGQASAAGRVPAGTKVTVDSNYEGYGPTPLTDGKINPRTDDWTQVAWASLDGPGDHWVQLDFPEARRVAKVTVHWAWDNGAYYNSQQIAVETRQGQTWVPLEVTGVMIGEKGAQTVVLLKDAEVKSLRIRQPAGLGPASRPDIMWVSEVEVQ